MASFLPTAPPEEDWHSSSNFENSESSTSYPVTPSAPPEITSMYPNLSVELHELLVEESQLYQQNRILTSPNPLIADNFVNLPDEPPRYILSIHPTPDSSHIEENINLCEKVNHNNQQEQSQFISAVAAQLELDFEKTHAAFAKVHKIFYEHIKTSTAGDSSSNLREFEQLVTNYHELTADILDHVENLATSLHNSSLPAQEVKEHIFQNQYTLNKNLDGLSSTIEPLERSSNEIEHRPLSDDEPSKELNHASLSIPQTSDLSFLDGLVGTWRIGYLHRNKAENILPYKITIERNQKTMNEVYKHVLWYSNEKKTYHWLPDGIDRDGVQCTIYTTTTTIVIMLAGLKFLYEWEKGTVVLILPDSTKSDQRIRITYYRGTETQI